MNFGENSILSTCIWSVKGNYLFYTWDFYYFAFFQPFIYSFHVFLSFTHIFFSSFIFVCFLIFCFVLLYLTYWAQIITILKCLDCILIDMSDLHVRWDEVKNASIFLTMDLWKWQIPWKLSNIHCEPNDRPDEQNNLRTSRWTRRRLFQKSRSTHSNA